MIFLLAIQMLRGQSASTPPELLVALMVAPNGTSFPTFEVELTNSANHDLILNLGMMLGHGRQQYPYAIHLSLKDDQNTEILELKTPPIVSEPIDPFIVPLPKGAHMILPINLADYWVPKQKVSEIRLRPGQYFLRAEYQGEAVQFVNVDTPRMKLMPCWLGRANSSELPFAVPDK